MRAHLILMMTPIYHSLNISVSDLLLSRMNTTTLAIHDAATNTKGTFRPEFHATFFFTQQSLLHIIGVSAGGKIECCKKKARGQEEGGGGYTNRKTE